MSWLDAARNYENPTLESALQEYEDTRGCDPFAIHKLKMIAKMAMREYAESSHLWNAILEELAGQTFTKITRINSAVTNENGDQLIFETATKRYRFYHNQDCCENVYIEDVIGDLDDLIGVPLTFAEERSEQTSDKDSGNSTTWTFYEFVSPKGSVTVRWCGSSNGYYSERVDFEEMDI